MHKEQLKNVNPLITGALFFFLLFLVHHHAPAESSYSDTLQAMSNNFSGAKKIDLLLRVSEIGYPADCSFLEQGISSLRAHPELLMEKRSLDSLYKLVNVLSEYQIVDLIRPLVYLGSGTSIKHGNFDLAFLFELALSDLFFNLNEADSATVHLNQASQTVETYDLHSQDHVLVNRRARIAEMKGMKLEALGLFLQSAGLYRAKNMQTELAVIYNNIGTLHLNLKNLAESVKYLKMADAINQKPGLETQRNITYTNLGVAYKEYDSLPEAIEWYNKSIALSRQVDDGYQLARVYFNLGNAIQLMGRLDEAKALYDSSMYYCKKLNIDYGTLLITINLGEWHYQKKEYTKALECLKAAENKLKNYNLPVETGEVFRLYALVYEATGNHPDALKYYRAHVSLKDSLEMAESNRSILELQARYEQERSAKEIASLNEAIQAGKARTRLYIIIFIIIIVVLFASGTYLFIHRRISVYKARLALQENEKLRMEMETKDKELMSKAVYMGHFDEMVSNLGNRLKELMPSSSEENSVQLKKIIHELKAEGRKGTWKEFEVRFEQVHKDFSARLLASCPSLSPAEIRICSFLRLNMTSKEIALISNRSLRTVENTRNNIRAKMKLPPEANLVGHLLGI